MTLMDMKAGVPLRNSLETEAKEYMVYHENVVPRVHPIYLAAKFPIDQVSKPDRLVR